MIGFDTEQLYMFEVYGKNISHLNIFPYDSQTLTRTLDMENKRRIELYPALIEVAFDEKGLNYQKEMLDRFMSMFAPQKVS